MQVRGPFASGRARSYSLAASAAPPAGQPDIYVTEISPASEDNRLEAPRGSNFQPSGPGSGTGRTPETTPGRRFDRMAFKTPTVQSGWNSRRGQISGPRPVRPCRKPRGVSPESRPRGESHPPMTCSPASSRDSRTLFFASDRPGGAGNLDLYMTTRTRAKKSR